MNPTRLRVSLLRAQLGALILCPMVALGADLSGDKLTLTGDADVGGSLMVIGDADVGGSLLIGDRSFTAEISGPAATGDLIIPLGSYPAGVSISMDVRVEGHSAEIGGHYQLHGAWSGIPTVTLRSEHSAMAGRLLFCFFRLSSGQRSCS